MRHIRDMCNRYRMLAKQAEPAAAHGITAPYPEDVTLPPPEPFPKRLAYVVREHEGARALDVMNWGFPHIVTSKTGKPTESPLPTCGTTRRLFVEVRTAPLDSAVWSYSQPSASTGQGNRASCHFIGSMIHPLHYGI